MGSVFLTARFALSRIPKVQDQLDLIGKEITVSSDWHELAKNLKAFRKTWNHQALDYINHIAGILEAVVQSKDEMKELIENLGSISWERADYEARVQEAIGPSYILLVESNVRLGEAIQNIMEEVEVDDKPLIHLHTFKSPTMIYAKFLEVMEAAISTLRQVNSQKNSGTIMSPTFTSKLFCRKYFDRRYDDIQNYDTKGSSSNISVGAQKDSALKITARGKKRQTDRARTREEWRWLHVSTGLSSQNQRTPLPAFPGPSAIEPAGLYTSGIQEENQTTLQASRISRFRSLLQRLSSWQHVVSRTRKCYILITLGLSTIIGSLIPAMWEWLAHNDLSGGFAAAQYVIGVGAFVIGALAAFHVKSCRCWIKERNGLDVDTLC